MEKVLIIGGGPAGLSAALWLYKYGFEVLVVEAEKRSGGLLNKNYQVNDWLLGTYEKTGQTIAQQFRKHIKKTKIKILQDTKATKIRFAGKKLHIEYLKNGKRIQDSNFSACVIASGLSYRNEDVFKNISGIKKIPEKLIRCGPEAFTLKALRQPKRVLVVGGGDNAFENARMMCKRSRVEMIVRSKPRAQKHLLDSIKEINNSKKRCWIHENTKILSLNYDKNKIRVQITSSAKKNKIKKMLTVDCIHLLAGYLPNTAFLNEIMDGKIVVDANGYISIDDFGRTNFTGVYAAGDVSSPNFSGVVTALASGAKCAKTIERDLNPSFLQKHYKGLDKINRKAGYSYIYLDNIQVELSIGVYQYEKYLRNLDVAIVVGIPANRAKPNKDDINEVINYESFVEAVRKVVDKQQGKHFNLLETLAKLIAKECFKNENVQYLEVRINKPKAIDGRVDAGVEIPFYRSELSKL